MKTIEKLNKDRRKIYNLKYQLSKKYLPAFEDFFQKVLYKVRNEIKQMRRKHEKGN